MELHARRTDPSTSQKALYKIGKGQAAVITALTNMGNGGATSSQLANILGKERDSISPMMAKLEENNAVHYSGYQRKLAGHNWQIVWNIGLFIPKEGDRKMERRKPRENLKDLLIESRYALKDAISNTRTLNEINPDEMYLKDIEALGELIKQIESVI